MKTFFKLPNILWIATAFFSINPIHAGWPSHDSPIIESIKGTPPTVLLIQDGIKKEMSTGQSIEIGGRIKTHEKNSAILQYPDGSRITILKNSDFTVEGEIDGIRWNKLKEGTVRGIIVKPKMITSSKHRFMIRTKSAVLGVRGTDFVMSMELASKSVEVHTLEGTVEVANNEASLLTGKGTAVTEGQFIKSGQRGLSPPQVFNKSEFMKSFNQNIGASTPASISEPVSPSINTISQEVSNSRNLNIIPNSFPAPTHFSLPPPPPANSPEEQKKQEELKQEVQDKNKIESTRRIKILSFQTALFLTQLQDSSPIRAINAVWTPSIPIPLFSFLSVRGNFGGSFANQGSLASNFMVADFQIFATISLFDLFFIEAGIGEQIWRTQPFFDSDLRALNTGLLVKWGFIDKLIVGCQYLNTNSGLLEYKAGIGINLW